MNMKYSISREQHFFFEQNHYIEFDGLLSDVEHKSLVDALKKVHVQARDLSHTIKPVKAITHMTRLAKLASQLTHKTFLRFGFDQILCPPIETGLVSQDLCISGLVGLLYLSLDGQEVHAIFADPTADADTLPLQADTRYLVIGWAEERAMYVLQPNDPHTHELKKHGYVFGDRLKEEWHQILVR